MSDVSVVSVGGHLTAYLKYADFPVVDPVIHIICCTFTLLHLDLGRRLIHTFLIHTDPGRARQ